MQDSRLLRITMKSSKERYNQIGQQRKWIKLVICIEKPQGI